MNLLVNNITVKNLQVEINQKMILKGIDFDLCSGDCCLIVGKNGAGKSTLLNALIDIVPILQDGEISINNYNLKIKRESIEYKKLIGYSKGDNFLIEDFTLEENLLFITKVYNISKEVFTNQLDMFCEYFPIIKNLFNRKVSKFSTGEYKIATLCTSLLHNPEILIWDEPYSGIDLITNEKITQIINYLLLEGKIMLISSHEESVLNDIGTHILIIRNGFQSFFGKKESLNQGLGNFKNTILRFL